MRSTAAPYTESRLTRSVANERVGFPVVEQHIFLKFFPQIPLAKVKISSCLGEFLGILFYAKG